MTLVPFPSPPASLELLLRKEAFMDYVYPMFHERTDRLLKVQLSDKCLNYGKQEHRKCMLFLI
jgi:hypothetical protein